MERQANDGASVLNLCRDLIRLRKERSDLARGAYRRVPSPSGTWAYRRGDSIVVALNLSSAETDLEVGTGEVLAGTDRTREGERVSHRLPLRPFEAVVIEGPPQ